jgi:hypothetical protein
VANLTERLQHKRGELTVVGVNMDISVGVARFGRASAKVEPQEAE